MRLRRLRPPSPRHRSHSDPLWVWWVGGRAGVGRTNASHNSISGSSRRNGNPCPLARFVVRSTGRAAPSFIWSTRRPSRRRHGTLCVELRCKAWGAYTDIRGRSSVTYRRSDVELLVFRDSIVSEREHHNSNHDILSWLSEYTDAPGER